MRVGAVFGFFEALTPAIGYCLEYMLNDWIADYDHGVAFGLLLAVGAYMIREAFGQDDAPALGISLALMDANLWVVLA